MELAFLLICLLACVQGLAIVALAWRALRLLNPLAVRRDAVQDGLSAAFQPSDPVQRVTAGEPPMWDESNAPLDLKEAARAAERR